MLSYTFFPYRGFNEAVNGFTDEGWSVIGDSMDDVTITVNSSPDKLMGLNLTFSNGFTPVSSVVLCAKASMLLQVSAPLFFNRSTDDCFNTFSPFFGIFATTECSSRNPAAVSEGA